LSAAEPIAAIGDNTIDIYTGREEYSFVGGNAVNVAVQLTVLGRPARYFGAVGPDEAGQRVRQALASHGVDVAGVVVLPGRTSTSRIRVDHAGVRHFEYEDFAVCDDYIPDAAALESAAECGAAHLGLLPDAEPVRAYLAGRGVLVSQDCGVTKRPGSLTHLDIAFCSQETSGGPADRLAAEAIAAGARLAVVTCGADGSVASDGRRWWRAAAVPVDVVDTTGAGDSFAAGFLHARMAGADVDQAMRAGSEHAARACTHHGGWPQQALPPPSAGRPAGSSARE
jgi:fructoselysine 6-kinase